MGTRINLLGSVFGYLTVVDEGTRKKYSDERETSRVMWLCRCVCGNITFVSTDGLTSGAFKSCGCKNPGNRPGLDSPHYKHGLANTDWYRRIQAHNHRTRYSVKSRKMDTNAVKERMLELGNACVYCGGAFEEVDHILPLSKGGDHGLENLVPACKRCNAQKNNKILGVEWQPAIPREGRY